MAIHCDVGISWTAVAIGVVFAVVSTVVLLRSRHASRNEVANLNPWVATIGLVGVTLIAAFLIGTDDKLERDESIFVVTNMEVANGHLPYVAAFDNTGPIGPWYGGIGVAVGRLWNADTVTSARVAYLAVAVAATIGVYGLARLAGARTLPAAIGAAAMVVLPTFAREALSGPRPKAIVLVLVLLYVAALARRRFLLAGFALGLSTLVWQASFVLVIAPVAYWLWRKPEDNLARSVARFIGGGLTAAAPVLLVYAIAGQLPIFVDGFLLTNFELGTSRLPTSIVDAVVDPLKDLWGAHQATWPVIVLGALSLLPFSRHILTDNPEQVAATRVRDFATIAFLLLVGWTLFDYQGVVDLLPLWGLIGLGTALAVDRVDVRRRQAALALGLAILTVGAVDISRVDADGLDGQRMELEELLGDSCTVVSYGQPEALALAAQSNPSRFFSYRPGVNGPQPDDSNAYMATLIEDQPYFVGGWTTPDPSELGAAARASLPAAGYQPVELEHFQGWVLPETDCR